MASFTFGYNIGSTNLPTPLIKDFYAQRYFKEDYYDVLASLKEKEDSISKSEEEISKPENADSLANLQSKLNQSRDDVVKIKVDLKEKKEKIDQVNTLLWSVTTSLFVVGGMIGALASKYVLDYLGRKKGILFHYLFAVAGGVLVIIAPYVNSPECVIASRFLFGLQGGLMCGLIPVYLNEISPAGLRGATGVLSQLFITLGILIAQTLGFRQILGTKDCWQFLLALPIVPSLVGGLSLLFFFPESPKALLLVNKDKPSATKALQSLRNTQDVADEIESINQEAKDSKSDEAMSLKELFTSADLRWPLITGLIVNITQQLCGINAIFFYSNGIFERAKIEAEYIQYAIFATGLINVISTILVVPLIDRLGRKPLLVVPMFIMIVDFILLTVCLVLQDGSLVFSYLSVVCIIVFIMCFAVGLGPIPFLYVAECFKQDARGAALSVCMVANWVANLFLTLTFEYMAMYLKNYVFVVFTVIVGFAVFLIITKVPETKGRTVDEIMAYFGVKKSNDDESKGKLMEKTVV